jgi:hypothetical protein
MMAVVHCVMCNVAMALRFGRQRISRADVGSHLLMLLMLLLLQIRNKG